MSTAQACRSGVLLGIYAKLLHSRRESGAIDAHPCRWAENMKFDSGIAVASASEVARDGKGTCFGYSVLSGTFVNIAASPLEAGDAFSPRSSRCCEKAR